MTCFDSRAAQTTSFNILDLLKRLDKMQKDVALLNELDTCENCMLTSMYNTKPISLYTACGQITATLGAGGTTTNLFRVETIKGDTVYLRLLQDTAGVITCTPYTLIVNVSCICSVQCFDPINCDTTCIPPVLN